MENTTMNTELLEVKHKAENFRSNHTKLNDTSSIKISYTSTNKDGLQLLIIQVIKDNKLLDQQVVGKWAEGNQKINTIREMLENDLKIYPNR